MNFSQAYSIAYENANPYEDQCDEERCVNGKHCESCNHDLEPMENEDDE